MSLQMRNGRPYISLLTDEGATGQGGRQKRERDREGEKNREGEVREPGKREIKT